MMAITNSADFDVLLLLSALKTSRTLIFTLQLFKIFLFTVSHIKFV
jgi:hypothetical protein